MTTEVRRRLLARFGLFGIRLSTSLIRQGAADPAALAKELVDRSGLRELEQVLHTQFTERRDVLKARSALLAVDAVLRTGDGGARRGPLAREIDRILAGAHEFTELRLLGALRSGTVNLPPATPTTASGCWATPAPPRRPGSASRPTRRLRS